MLNLVIFNLDSTVQYNNNTMISKIIGSCLPFCRFTNQILVYSFSDVNFKADQAAMKQVLKLQTCNSIRDIMQYLSKNRGEASSSDINLLFQKANYLKNSQLPWENYSSINMKLKNLDIDNADISTLANIAGISTLLNQHQSFSIKIFLKIAERVQKLLAEGQRLSDQVLMSFLQLSCEVNKYSFVEAVNKQLMKRIPELKYKNYTKYLQVVNKKKFPVKIQKQAFTMFITKFEADIQKIDVRFAINCYKHLKNLNRNLYNYGDVVKLLEQKIKNSIDDLDEKEILSLVNFKSNNNIFQKIIYVKVVDSIDENGEVPFDSNSIFKLLTKLTENESIKLLGAQKEAKVMKFIEKNIDKMHFINQLIKKNFFTRSQLLKLNQFIFEKQITKFQKNVSYTYELTSRGIYQNDNNKLFLQSVRAENPVCTLSQKYLSSALIIDRLYHKDHANQQLKDMRDYFVKTTQGFKESQQIFKNPLFLNKNKLIENFNRKFGNIYLKSLIDNLIQKNQKLSTNFLLYLLCANDYKSFSKILKSKNNNLQFYLIKPILQRVSNHPSSFIGTFEFINRTLTDLQISKSHMKHVVNYLCNWEVHLLLQTDEIKSFLKLARKVVSEDKYLSATDFISYFIRTPSKLIKKSLQYPQLLNEIQLRQQKKVKAEQGSSQSKDRDRPIVSFNVGLQLAKLNILNKFYAEKLSTKIYKDGFLKNYCDLVCGKTINWDSIEITPQNLVLVTKCNNFTDEELIKLLPKIKEAILKANEVQLEDAILNIEMKKSSKAFEIVNALTDAYTQKISSNNRETLRLELVLLHLQSYNYKSNQYKILLSKILQNFTKNMNNLPFSVFPVILNQCLSRGVQCKQFINKIISLQETKINRGQASWNNIMDILEYVLVADASQSLKLFNFISRSHHYSEKLLSNLVLIDPSDEKYQKQIFRYFENAGEIQINEGIFRFLLAKNPSFSKFESKLKFTNAKQKSWIREKLIKFMTTANISYEQKEKYGHHLFKIGKNYMVFSNRNYNPQLAEKMKDYFATLFDIPNQEHKNIIVLFLNSKFNSNFISHILANDIQQFKNQKQKILQILQEKTQKRINQIPQNLQNSPQKSKQNKKQSRRSQKNNKKQQKQDKKAPQNIQNENKEEVKQQSSVENAAEKKQ